MVASNVAKKAAEQRDESVTRLLSVAGMRSGTVNTAKQIDAACRHIDVQNGKLSVSNVARVLRNLYPGESPAESSIRNKTETGAIYRAVIDAWRTYRLAKSPAATRAGPELGDPDIPDLVLHQIQPEAARFAVLAMRTALRNVRRQLQLAMSLTPDRLVRSVGVRPASSQSAASGESSGPTTLSRDEVETIAAFLAEAESAVRGLHWSPVGQLENDSGEPLSRPGLADALRRAMGVAK